MSEGLCDRKTFHAVFVLIVCLECVFGFITVGRPLHGSQKCKSIGLCGVGRRLDYTGLIESAVSLIRERD